MKTIHKPRSATRRHPLSERFEMRMTKEERQSFLDAARQAGLDLSAWARSRLKLTANQELCNTIEAKDPWAKFAGAFADTPVFEEVMEVVARKRRQEKRVRR